MNILLVTDQFPPVIGGAGAVPEALAAHSEGRTAVVAPEPTAEMHRLGWQRDADRHFSFPVLRVPAFMTVLSKRWPRRLRAPLQFAYNTTLTRPRAAAAILRFLASHPVDVVCINTLLPCYWVPQELKKKYPGLTVVFYLHGEEVATGNQRTRLDLLAQTSLRQADGVITVSRYTRERALECDVSAAKVEVIHNGVDTTRFTPGAKDPELMSRFNLAGRRVLLCLARLDERKGQDTLLRAMPAILAAVPETVLLLVGGGSDEARLRALVQELDLERSVCFAGVAPAEDLVRFYRLADVYAMPNRTTEGGDTEGFGLTFLEAGACGKPVIGGRAGGVPDAIVDGETGLLVDGTSSSDVAKACIRLLSDRDLAAAMGQNGLTHAVANTWPKQAKRFLSFCEELLGRPN